MPAVQIAAPECDDNNQWQRDSTATMKLVYAHFLSRKGYTTLVSVRSLNTREFTFKLSPPKTLYLRGVFSLPYLGKF